MCDTYNSNKRAINTYKQKEKIQTNYKTIIIITHTPNEHHTGNDVKLLSH
jgi:hypothetical protein